MNLENEISTSWTLFGSGTPVYKNGDKLEVDEPQLPPLTITPKAKPEGDPSQSNVPPDQRVAPNVDWNDPDVAAQYGTSELRPHEPGWRGKLVYGTVDLLSGLGMDEKQARTVAERVWGAAGPLGDQIGVVDGAAIAAAPFAMGAAAPISAGAMAAIGAPSLVLQTEESIRDIANGIEGIKAGRDGAEADTAWAIGFTLLNALGIGELGRRGAGPAQQILGDTASFLRDNAGTIAKVGGALTAGGAALAPDDAEAGILQKLARSPKGTITKLGKAEGETVTQFIERMNREAPIVTNADEFVRTYGDLPPTSAAQPSDAVAWRITQDKDTVPVLPTGQMGEKATAASPFAQIGGYFDSLVRMKNGGAPREWSNPEHARQILDEAASEVKYQLALGDPRKADFTKKTGWGWYDEDTQRMYNTAAKTMPELGMNAKRGVKVPWGDSTDNVTPEQSRILLAAVGAPQSFGNPAKRNADIALQAYEVFRKTGQFPEKGIYLNSAGAVESTGSYWTQRAVSQQYIGVLNTLIREIGPAKAADWLVSPHTIAELRDLKRRATDAAGEKIFKGDTSMGISGKADEIKPGAFIFGPKGGQFMGNLLGFPGTTTDMWFTRSWNRYLGKSREGVGALSETGLVEQPRNLGERADMADFSKQLTDQLNQDQDLVTSLGRPMTERDTQAVLWYFEQFLYNEMGVKVTPTSFGEGAAAYAKRAKEQGGTGIAPR